MIRFCPENKCRLTNNGPTRLTVLSAREGRGAFRPYVDPVDGTRIYACPTHGRYEEDRAGRLHKRRLKA